MFIELKTLFVVYIVINIICVIVMSSLWRQNRNRFPEISLWLAYYILQLVSLILVTLRDSVPDLVSIFLANTLIVGGMVALYIGLEVYTGERSRQIHNYIMVAVFTAAHAYLTYIYPSLTLRNVNLSLALFLVGSQGAWLMLHRVKPGLRPVTRPTGLVLIAFCLVCAVHIIYNLTKPQISRLFMSGFLNALIILAYQALFIALTFALVLLVNRRLLTSLESELTGRRQMEELIRVRLTLLEFAAAHSLEELLQKVLDEVGYLVDSPIGFYHFVEADQKTLSLQAWSTRTIKEFCKIEGKGMHYGIDQAGVWVDCVREKRTVIHNDYNSLPNRKGLPTGHAAVIRELVVPIMREGKIMAILGVGNKPADYTEKDVKIVSYLADVAWEITQSKQAEEELKETSEYLNNLINYANSPIIVWDTKFKITRFNKAFERITGRSAKDVIGKYVELLFPEEMKQQSLEYIRKTVSGEKWETVEILIKHVDGTTRTLLWNSANIYSTGGKTLISTIAQGQDITDRKHAEELLAEERMRLANILEGTNVGTWEWNIQTGETVFNERWAEMIGYTLAELEPVSIDTWIKYTHPDDLSKSKDLLERHFGGELPYYECEFRMHHKDDCWIWILDRGKVITWTDDGRPLFMSGTHQEITARKQAEEQISHMATHDILTDLPTMRLVRDRLSVALSTAHRHKNMAAVMFIDLDGFKSINDTLGHNTGDYVLKQVAERMLSCVRETDTVARVGGDEFLIIATELHSADDAAQIAKKTISLVSQPIALDNQNAAIGASIGIAIYPVHGEDIDQLIQLADEAMYSVKSSGKNNFAFVQHAGKESRV